VHVGTIKLGTYGNYPLCLQWADIKRDTLPTLVTVNVGAVDLRYTVCGP